MFVYFVKMHIYNPTLRRRKLRVSYAGDFYRDIHVELQCN